MNKMRSALASSLAILNIAGCLALQFVSPPPERVHGPFGSARSQGVSSHENSILIRSKPYNISGNNNSGAENKVQRNVYIQREESSEENYAEPKLPQYAIDCGSDKACLEAHGMDAPEPTFKPYTQEELERLLAQYTASHGSPPEIEGDSATNKLANLYMDDEESVINVLESNPKHKDQETSKSASWHLVNSQKHNHPYDDKKGWVTLEPVPWAQSQIQKWEPNAKPQIPSWETPNYHRPSDPWDSKPPNDFSTQRPWSKPSYEYQPHPQWSQWTRPNDFPDKPTHWGGNQDIITDDRPGYFPGPQPSHRPWYDQESYSSNRPQIYEERPAHHPPTHPAEGDGQWVLLSTTKGYSVPQRDRGKYQRALTFNPNTPTPSVATMSSHRTVRLTVLPAENSTATTLSHGGLLEVESTFQTVEEAQREHAAKMLKLKTPKAEEEKSKLATKRSNSQRSGNEIKVFSASTSDSQSKAAVLAAIGAGMIPATMAMLAPMVLGRRRRSVHLAEDRHSLDRVLQQQNYSYLKSGEQYY